jgi:hypothetical protein
MTSLFRPARDPAKQFERQYAKYREYLDYATEADAAGQAGTAVMWRRKASAVKGAMTRLAKTAGWQ